MLFIVFKKIKAYESKFKNSQRSQRFYSKILPNRLSHHHTPTGCHEKPIDSARAPHLFLLPYAYQQESSAEWSSLHTMSNAWVSQKTQKRTFSHISPLQHEQPLTFVVINRHGCSPTTSAQQKLLIAKIPYKAKHFIARFVTQQKRRRSYFGRTKLTQIWVQIIKKLFQSKYFHNFKLFFRQTNRLSYILHNNKIFPPKSWFLLSQEKFNQGN